MREGNSKGWLIPFPELWPQMALFPSESSVLGEEVKLVFAVDLCCLVLQQVGSQMSAHDVAIRYQRYKPLISLYTFALGNNWRSLTVLETAFLFLAEEQT